MIPEQHQDIEALKLNLHSHLVVVQAIVIKTEQQQNAAATHVPIRKIRCTLGLKQVF